MGRDRQGKPIGAGEPGGFAAMSESDWQAVLDDPMSFDPDELREFLAADIMDVPVDPVFKEQLRRLLWELVRTRYGGES